MKTSIKSKLGALLLLFALGALVNLAVVYHFVSETRRDAALLRLVDDVHPKRWSGFLARVGLGDEEAREGLGHRIDEAEHAFGLLDAGGRIEGAVVGPAPRELSGLVKRLREEWKPVRQDLAVVAQRPARHPEARAAVSRVNGARERLAGQVEQLVARFGGREKRRHAWMLTGLIGVAALNLVLLLGGLWIIENCIARPLRLIEDGARRIQAADFGHRVPIVSRDEFATLAETVNSMAAEVGRLVTDVQEARDHAEDAGRAKGEFLANISHEIRTPLNGIIGMTDLAIDISRNAEQREYLEMAKSSALSLLEIVNDILDFSKIEARKLELDPVDFSLRTMIGDAINAVALKADEKRLELILDLPPDVPDLLVGDDGRLRQVLINLLGNAVKFTPSGEIELQVRTQQQNDERATLVFAVRDTGIGIIPEKRRQVFDAFVQVDGSTTRKYGGTGLGLAISYHLVRLMGGEIWVESEPGRGSTFFFTVRLGLQEGFPAGGAPIDLGGRRVLVVEDNAAARRALESLLRGLGAQTECVDNGRSVPSLLRDASDANRPFSLALLDGSLADSDSFDLSVACGTGATPCVMMLTAAAAAVDGARCREAGIAGHLVKPVRQPALVELLRALLSEQPQAPQGSAQPALIAACSGLRLLLVEDNLVNQRMAARLLEKHGHTVAVAANGRYGVELLSRERFDAVLMDVQMPEMNGFEATAAIRERELAVGGHVPIIAVTANAMKGDREACLAAGMDAYVSKPVQVRELLETLARFVPQERRIVSMLPETEAPAPLDRSELLARFDGDEELLSELLQLYLETYPQLLAELETGLSAHNAEAVAGVSHTLKGMMGNFGAGAVVEAATRLEKIGRSGNLVGAAEALESLAAQLHQFTDSLPAESSNAPSGGVLVR